MPIKLPDNMTFRNVLELTPNVWVCEGTHAQRVTANSVWHTFIYALDKKGRTIRVGSTRNTRRWGSPVIRAEVWGVPSSTQDYISMECATTQMDVAARFLTTLAKEFWP